MAEIELTGLSFNYDSSKIILDDINLKIREGDRLGIIGKNGAGKSTLLKIISGLITPTSGTVNVVGTVASIFNLGLAFREDLTGIEAIRMEGLSRLLPKKEIDKKVEEIATFSELGDFINYPIRTYSTGMRAKLSFSTLSFLSPEILVIDETLSVGDKDFNLKAKNRIMDLSNTGKILLLTSHSMSAINEFCNRAILIEDSKIIIDDKPETVTNFYVKKVLAMDEELNINFFQNKVEYQSIIGELEILSLDIFTNTHNEDKSIIETGEAITIRVKIERKKNLNSFFNASLVISRSDEVLVYETQKNDIDSFSEFQDFNILSYEIPIKDFPLNAGYYAFRFVIGNSNVIIASKTRFVKVKNSLPHTGGKPVYVGSYKPKVTKI
jgi:lipopolysaccharide transport system ATP-binding protein